MPVLLYNYEEKLELKIQYREEPQREYGGPQRYYYVFLCVTQFPLWLSVAMLFVGRTSKCWSLEISLKKKGSNHK